jgi:hypothetical protein
MSLIIMFDAIDETVRIMQLAIGTIKIDKLYIVREKYPKEFKITKNSQREKPGQPCQRRISVLNEKIDVCSYAN